MSTESEAADLLADERVRALAREILSQAQYARWRPSENPLLALLERLKQEWQELGEALRQWLPDWLVAAADALMDWLRSWGWGGSVVVDGLSPLEWAAALLWLAAVAVALYALARSVHRRMIDARTGLADPADPPRHRLLLAEARALAEEGRLLDAAHHAQLATLQLLLERRWLELERSEPNRTLRRRITEAELPAALRGEFLILLDRLESHWFRDRAEDGELYLSWCRLHERMASLAVPS